MVMRPQSARTDLVVPPVQLGVPTRRQSTALAMSTPRRSATDLVERAAAGDAGAFIAILKEHDQRLRTLAARLLAGDAHAVDDALQNAYLQAFRAMPRYRHDADIGTWLHRITYNACIDEIRRNHGRPHPTNAEDALRHTPTPGAAPDVRATVADTVRRALAALPPDQRAAVVLVDAEGFDHATAARLLGVAPGTVASRLARARSAIRHHIGEDDK
jgi:RNA polymerase sigma-70 factor, ECF subfamily